MIAAMRSIVSDEITAVHRTRLSEDGQKLDRRMLGIAAGAAIKIDADDAVTSGLHIAEGVETAMAARRLGLKPTWALGSTSFIAAFPVLPGVECLTILAENDAASAKAVQTCAARWHAAGRIVLINRPSYGKDLNDALKGAA
jgi:putative DNA primase/helicase